MEVATRLGRIIRQHRFKSLDGEQITISAGISTFQDNGVQSCDQLLQRADKAMYQAKAQGKDRVVQA